MLLKADVNQIGSYLHNNGLILWSNARVIRSKDNNYTLSIPSILNDSISSVLIVSKYDDYFQYITFSLEDALGSTNNLKVKYGIESVPLLILELLMHERNFGNYQHSVLYRHLADPDIADQILEVVPRGWCLIEVELLIDEPVLLNDDEVCNCMYYNMLTGYTVLNPSADFDPSKDDPSWLGWHPGQPYLYRYRGSRNSSIIHGQTNQSGYTVFHFWAWCDDAIGQDPWTFNWTTNSQSNTGGIEGTNPDPDWDYDFTRWDEDVKECLFAFDDPRATEQINRLEEELLTSSCGEASEYTIKSIIDDIVIGLCNEYYQNQENSESGPHLPGEDLINTSNLISNLTSSIMSHAIYNLGISICEICEDDHSPTSCYEDFDNCSTEDYETCAEDLLCEKALYKFSSTFGITLSREEKDLIKQNVSSCGGAGFEGEAMDIWIESLELDLNYGMTPTEIELLKEGRLINEIRVPKIDWSTSTEVQKITHLYWCLAIIQYQINISSIEFVSGLRDYSIKDFFTNTQGLSVKELHGPIDLHSINKEIVLNKYPYLNNLDFTIVINRLYDVETFFPSGTIQSSEPVHYFYSKTGSQGVWGFSIIDFVVPNMEWNNFYKYMNR